MSAINVDVYTALTWCEEMRIPGWLCPVCHEQPYNPRLDIESPAVQ